MWPAKFLLLPLQGNSFQPAVTEAFNGQLILLVIKDYRQGAIKLKVAIDINFFQKFY